MKDMVMKDALGKLRSKGIDLTIVIGDTEPDADDLTSSDVDNISPNALSMDNTDPMAQAAKKQEDEDNAKLGLAPDADSDQNPDVQEGAQNPNQPQDPNAADKMAAMLDKGPMGKLSGFLKKKGMPAKY